LNKRLWIKILAFIAALYVGYTATQQLSNQASRKNDYSQAESSATSTLDTTNDLSNASAYSEIFKNNSEVTGNGKVIKILADDHQSGGNDGSRHQRFILKLPSGRTVLIVHNIDLAPRIELLNKNDTIVFKGIYISNDQGGLIHWTHHDPQGRHVGGWLKRNGRIYQ
jgi:Protein of unknown function (DUF3465)